MTKSITGLSVALPLTLSFACAGAISELDRPCPCAAGWTCCPDDVCVAPGTSCKTGDGGTVVPGESGAVAAGKGPVTPATCGYPIASAACVYTGACSDGSGYSSNTPAFCSDPTGPEQTFTSASQLTSALLGTWSACDTSSAGAIAQSFGQDAIAIQFLSDGSYTVFRQSPSLTLVPSSAPHTNGTFEVVVSLDAGTHQVLAVHDSGGQSAFFEIVVFASDRRLRFVGSNASDYVRAPSLQFQKNVCGPPLGPDSTPPSGADALARLTGKWAWCPTGTNTGGLFQLFGLGVEFPGDGTWYTLVEDSSGAFVRASDTLPPNHGTVTATGSSPASLTFISHAQGQTYGAVVLQPTLDECGTFVMTQSGTNAPQPSSQYVRLP